MQNQVLFPGDPIGADRGGMGRVYQIAKPQKVPNVQSARHRPEHRHEEALYCLAQAVPPSPGNPQNIRRRLEAAAVPFAEEYVYGDSRIH